MSCGIVAGLLLAGCASDSTDRADPSSGSGTDASIATSSTPPVAPTVVAGPLPDSAAEVSIVHVTDGDSFDVELDGNFETVRLIGMNANEGDECFGPEAADQLAALLDAGPVGIEVIDGRDDFGRLLAYAFVGDTNINLVMVAGGHAVARALSDHPLEAEFEAAGRRAQEQQLGFWAPDACGAASDASLEIADLNHNAPGPDDENPNGEWILIENTGATTADLTGWTVKDESSRHRFEFPAGTALEPGATAIVFSGCGPDTATEFFWCSDGGSIWSNSGDTGFLSDPSGNIVDSWSYSG